MGSMATCAPTLSAGRVCSCSVAVALTKHKFHPHPMSACEAAKEARAPRHESITPAPAAMSAAPNSSRACVEGTGRGRGRNKVRVRVGVGARYRLGRSRGRARTRRRALVTYGWTVRPLASAPLHSSSSPQPASVRLKECDCPRQPTTSSPCDLSRLARPSFAAFPPSRLPAFPASGSAIFLLSLLCGGRAKWPHQVTGDKRGCKHGDHVHLKGVARGAKGC